MTQIDRLRDTDAALDVLSRFRMGLTVLAVLIAIGAVLIGAAVLNGGW